MDYKELEEMLRADEDKTAQFKQALEGAKENGAKNDAEALSMAAAAVGCQLVPEQIEQYLASHFEVSDDDLDLVAGGKEDSWCAINYNCYTAFRHEKDENRDAACFADYNCMAVVLCANVY